ncbi:MAG: LysM peptidoglycan-binding domain-containing protein [Nitrospirae bacterium]|nr:LysM peptidoglycan-binding domain-containing protein [Nitrospirota bacterium]
MSKITKWIGIGAAVVGAAVFLFVNQTMAEKEGTASHDVVKGDTLWGITSSYLKDPFLWPKVWKANPDIKNPDLIYPGQKIAIPGAPAKPSKTEAEAKAEEKGAPEAVAAAKPEEAAAGAEEARPAVPPAPVDPTLKKLILSAGYVGSVPAGGEVVGSWDNKVLLGQEDTIYIAHGPNFNPQTGSKVSIVRTVRAVKHPITGRNLGYLIKSLGYAEVTATDGRVATARVIRSYDAIEEGDRVTDFAEPSGADQMVAGEVTPAVKGHIVETADNKNSNGQHDIVYIDRGRKDGIRVGAKFAVILPGLVKKARWSEARIQLPHQLVSEAKVISIQDGTATAVLVKSYKEVERGYEVQSRP